MLISAAGGLVVLNRKSHEPTRLFHSTDVQKTPNNAPTTKLDTAGFWHVSSDGNTVLATGSTYVYNLDVETGEILSSLEYAKKNGLFNPSRTYATAITDDKKVFIGTDNGLAITNTKLDEFEFVSQLSGSRFGAVQNLIKDTSGSLWMSASSLGVLKYTPQTKAWHAFGAEDGLHSKVASQGSMSVSQNDTLITATAVGASTGDVNILPRHFQDKLTLEAMDTRTHHKIISGDQIELASSIRDFSLELMVPEPIEGSRYKLAYRFTNMPEDAEQKFIYLDQPLSFRFLQSGDYSFEGYLISASGIASNTLAFGLTVQPYWWERLSTKLLFLLLCIGAISFIFFSRARVVGYRQSLIADERKRIAQDLHDNLLQDIFGARMIGRNLVDSVQDPESKESVERVLALLANSTEAARKSIGHLSKLSEVPAVSAMIDKQEFAKRDASNTDLQINEVGTSWYVSSHRRFFMFRILQEAVNNAFKHAEASKVYVSIEWLWSHVIITVSDDGAGFDQELSSQTTGYGLGSMYRMAKAARFSLKVTSKKDEGTLILLKASRFII